MSDLKVPLRGEELTLSRGEAERLQSALTAMLNEQNGSPNGIIAPVGRGNGYLGIPEFRAFFEQFGDDPGGMMDRGNTLFYAVFNQARLSGVRGSIEYQVLCRDCGQHVSKTCTYRRREPHHYEHANYEVSELSLKEHLDAFDRLVLNSIDTRMKHDMRLLVEAMK